LPEVRLQYRCISRCGAFFHERYCPANLVYRPIELLKFIAQGVKRRNFLVEASVDGLRLEWRAILSLK